MNDTLADLRPGRSCPVRYRYPLTVFAREPDIHADTLYVVGGVYGNRQAMDTILTMFGVEQGSKALVFNGDFNWFNTDAEGFEAINREVLSHIALRGNVETELASDDTGAGCGCAYPDSVSDAEVARSNQMLEQLRNTARRFPALRQKLAQLPMHVVAQVGAARIGLVHGDAKSLAGWEFDVSALDDPTQRAQAISTFATAKVDGFASSHTCLPVLREFSVADRVHWVINNGAAGMPNFANTKFGLLTRISKSAAPPGIALYGLSTAGVFIDALPIHYDHTRWLADFCANWPSGSPGFESYYKRIVSGPNYEMNRAKPIALAA